MFDYIIIGAGSAGCVVANRLSANPKNTVLLIEAGNKDKKLEIHVPAAYSKLNYSTVDWGYYTEPQPHVNNRKMYQPRGKTLGGSSSTNAMAYIRGHKLDYDRWETMGATGWNYAACLPYFKKSEHNEQLHDDFHGTTGELNVTFALQHKTPLADAFIDACVENKIPRIIDVNGAEQHGAALFQYTIKNGERHSAAKAFLKPIQDRKNLTVKTNAHVQRILIENDTAVGVEIVVNEKLEQIKARKEIILCAGAFGSPQILMLSGIGDGAELSEMGIEVKKELPGVGKNLHDHLFYGISALSKWKGTLNNVNLPFNQFRHTLAWLFQRKGPLTTSPLEAVAFFKTANNLPQPDLQLHFVPAHIGNDTHLAAGADFYNPKTYPKTDGFTILPSLIQPKSRGYVALRSKNPNDAPIIQPNYLTHPDDLQTLIKGYYKVKAIIESEAFKPFTAGVSFPEKIDSEAEIISHIQKTLESIYHPVGTCKMGQDAMSVVDPELRVYGVKNLRVADASVMPQVISGNTNAPTIMIAERAAEFLAFSNELTAKI